MKRLALLSGIILSSSLIAFADPAPEPAPRITETSSKAFTLDWDGTLGNTYFIQYSSDLISWEYMPVIKSGVGGPLGYGYSSLNAKLLYRLHYTNIPTTNPLTDDFDGDGINNWDEVRENGTRTSPLLADTNGDGIRDDGLVFAAQSDPDGAGMLASLNNGLIGRWDFESAAGFPVAFPSTPPSVGAALSVSNVTWSPFGGMPSHAASLGNSSHLRLPPQILDGLDEITYSLWIKLPQGSLPGTTGMMKTLVSVGPNSTLPPLFHWYLGANNKMYLDSYWVQPGYYKSPLANWTHSAGLDDNKWHHLALVTGDAKYKLYMDGENLGEMQTNNLGLYNLHQAGNLGPYFQIGKARPTPPDNDYLQADIDRVRIYNRKLTTTEVLALCQTDSDGDGLFDWYEKAHTPERVTYFNDINADEDKDGLSSGQEQTAKTNLLHFDSDGDLLPDGWEVLYGLDPLSSAGNNGKDGHRDSDVLTNFEEYIHGTNPTSSDSDGDGTDDAAEVTLGGDPNDASDGGNAPPAERIFETVFRVGDPSSSHSERWQMTITGTTPEIDKRKFNFITETFGEVDEKSFKLRRGASYEITLTHVATNKSNGEPDYDWEASVAGKPTGAGTDPENQIFTIQSVNATGKTTWIVDNQDGLLTSERQGNENNLTISKKATLLPVEIQVRKPQGGGWQTTSELKISKWEGAWGSAGFRDDFIDQLAVGGNIDRFRIRIGIDNLPEEYRKFYLSSKGSGAEHNDNVTESLLTKDPARLGFPSDGFVSKPMILVADTADNKFKNDNAQNDQTHIVALGSDVEFRIKEPTGGVVATLPVKVRGTVHVQCKIVSPNGEIREALIEKVWDDIKAAGEIYAQIGLAITADIQFVPVPEGVDLSDGLTLNTMSNLSDLEAEGLALLNSCATPNNQSDIVAIYVDSTIYTSKVFSGKVKGIAFPKGWGNADNFQRTFLVTLGSSYDPSVFSHELCHLLLQFEGGNLSNHFSEPNNLMKGPAEYNGSYLYDNKRLILEQETQIYKFNGIQIAQP